MNVPSKLGGAVVPLVTPATASGQLDLDALDRLLESQIVGGVEGVLLLGTTGEGPCVPRTQRKPLIRHAATFARKRTLIYANVAENSLADAIACMEDYFQAGADVVVALAPFYYPSRPAELTAWFRALLEAASGPVVLYNIPITTRVSIPLEVIGDLMGHRRLVGIKDSENDPKRHDALLQRFGRREDFSIFVGVGALMAQGLKSGADGIVPSVGNLIPDVCHRLCAAAQGGNWTEVAQHAERMNALAALYQKGRTLAQSLAALKALLHCRGLCSPHMFPPLLPVSSTELDGLRGDMVQLNVP
jgi:dihydrodipicolinate synthase/N-acetylneuraminate lyase